MGFERLGVGEAEGVRVLLLSARRSAMDFRFAATARGVGFADGIEGRVL